MSGVIADTLAAHRPFLDITLSGKDDLTCFNPATLKFCGWQHVSDDPVECHRAHAAHQAEVLAAAGVGDLRALLDDLRGLAKAWHNDYHLPGQPDCPFAADLTAVLARYAPSDPTPKEQP